MNPQTPEDLAAPPVSRQFSVKQRQRAREFLTRLYALRRTVRFYPTEHPAVAQTIEDLLEVLVRFHDEGVDVPITFYEDELLLGDQLLAEDSLLFDQLIRDMTSIGVGTFTFKKGLDGDEVARFAKILGLDPETTEKRGGIGKLMEDAKLPHIEVSTVTVLHNKLSPGDGRKAARAAYNDAVDLLRELDHMIRSKHTLDVPRIKASARDLVDNIVANRPAMLELSGLKDYDEYTFYHSVNVAILALSLGSLISTEHRFLTSLSIGALLHDIGKMMVPAEILNKPGPLTSEEWAQIRRHPLFGAEHAALTAGLDKAAIVILFEHHMRFDLSGYPHQEILQKQHLGSRIVAVADAYDAMTSKRSYSSARLQDEAIRVLVENAGTALDPSLVRLFIGMLGAYPPRSVVRLSSGEIAIVVQASAHDVLLPRVRVIADAHGAMLEPLDVDLFDSVQAAGRTVTECLDPSGMNVQVADFM